MSRYSWYRRTTLGSSNLSLRAWPVGISDILYPNKSFCATSNQIPLWSPGISPKARYPARTAVRDGLVKMPSMGVEPLWYVGGAGVSCFVVIASFRPKTFIHSVILWPVISSFQSPIKISCSPAACHSTIDSAKSFQKTEVGFCLRYASCCAYTVDSPVPDRIGQ